MQAIKFDSFVNTLIIFVSTIVVGYFFIQIYPIEQRAVDAGLVLSKLVNYPDEISPLKEYYFKSWTLIHQIAKLFLILKWSTLDVSKVIIFITTVFYFLGIVLTVKASTKKIWLAILIALMTLIFQKNFGDTDYPSMIFSENTYGALSLALVTFIFGLLISYNLFAAGLFSSLLISVHPVIGVWINGIIILSIIINNYYFNFSFNKKSFFKGFIIGAVFSGISFFYHYISTPDFNSLFNLETYNNYMKYWDGHRTSSIYHMEYLTKTFFLFVLSLISLVFFKKNFTENLRFGLFCFLVSIFASTLFYFIYKIFYPLMPDLIKLIIPSRFTIMHSVIGWPLILGIIFVFIKKLETKNKLYKNLSYISIIMIILIYSISHHKIFIRLKTSFTNNYIEKVVAYDEKIFWNTVKNTSFDGYVVTSYSSSTISMRKGFKPIILDVTSFDFVPYFPNTAQSLKKIIEEIYEIEFTNPPQNLKNSASINDEIIKKTFKKRTKENWEKLSKNFNFKAIIVPSDWEIQLTPYKESKRFTFYIL
tara:strand:- start:3443 stop:5044 length:1602 start_codon:yes stop_codon:yes gene_type:complete